jgi:hypothetical protein
MHLDFSLQYQYTYYLLVHSFQETFHLESSSEPTLDQSDEGHMLGSTSTTLDSEKSERLVL